MKNITNKAELVEKITQILALLQSSYKYDGAQIYIRRRRKNDENETLRSENRYL